jgi:hypothetical protein
MFGQVRPQCLCREFGNGNHDPSPVALHGSWRFVMQFANQRAFREKPFGWSTAVTFEVLRRALDIARGRSAQR